VAEPGHVLVWVEGGAGLVQLAIPRRLVSAANPHQLLVIVFLASALMAGIAFQFLRLQIRPIRRLGEAAEAYGRGENMPLKSAGAREIRAASLAFIDMRNRLERASAQRKIMLSGVSHDMRTPLTRMRLILSMMPEDEDTRALRREIGDLERLLDSFLDYSRGQGAPVMAPLDPGQIVHDLVGRYRAMGLPTEASLPSAGLGLHRLDRALIERALDNLLSNARRHATRAQVTASPAEGGGLCLSVEDDGPGIAPRDRARALDPFVRLDEARNQDSGGGMGLGLAIVSEIARAHGGTLDLGESPALGGLRARLVLPGSADQSR
jgi:two-component system osmolarity sensor histidine kinase EnvZ